MNVTSIAATRGLSPDLMLEQVEPDGGSEALATADHVLGHPGRRASALGGLTVGLWEAGPGDDVDVEATDGVPA